LYQDVLEPKTWADPWAQSVVALSITLSNKNSV